MRLTILTAAVAMLAVALSGCSTTCTSCSNKKLPLNDVYHHANVGFDQAGTAAQHYAQPIAAIPPATPGGHEIQQVIHWGNSAGCGCGRCAPGCGHAGCGIGANGACLHPYGGRVPHTAPFAGPYGTPAPQYAYPYYTTRGPRDFLADGCGPPPIIPATPRPICLPSIGW